jgi:predicted Zn finger-like uncharacterized protein
MFKVVPDQLKISEGWVRCGKCEEIFDAAAHMQDATVLPAEPPAPTAADEPAFEGVLASAMGSGAAAAPAEIHVSLHEVPGRTEPQLEAPAQDYADTLLLPDGSAYGTAEAATQRAVDPVPERPKATPATSSAAELSFMRKTRPPSRWHRPLARATLIVISLMLVLGLALQLLVQERDRIAAVEPGLRPLVMEACLLLGCEVRPLRQIESVVIDSSAFSKIKGDLYRLSLTLKNNAPTDLAMPAVELALTDTLDHALIRRVLQPEDLGVKGGVIRAASETQATLLLTVKTNGNGERVAGYRLLAFYP